MAGAQTRGDFTVVRDATARQMRVLRPQPHAVAERSRILHRAKQHLRIGKRRVGMRERDAAGLGELAHFGERFAAKPQRQRTDRIHMRLVDHACAMLQHFDESRLVERGSVSGGHARLVTPPAAAAASSDSSVALCSSPGSRSRAARSTKPGATTHCAASITRSARHPEGALSTAAMTPSAT
jgi:hypothetical protein